MMDINTVALRILLAMEDRDSEALADNLTILVDNVPAEKIEPFLKAGEALVIVNSEYLALLNAAWGAIHIGGSDPSRIERMKLYQQRRDMREVAIRDLFAV